MAIIIKPTKIKTGFYLLVPKDIANYIGLQNNTNLVLDVSFGRKKIIIKYIEKKKIKHLKIKRSRRQRKKLKRRRRGLINKN